MRPERMPKIGSVKMDNINAQIDVQEKLILEMPHSSDIVREESKETVSDSHSRALELEESYQASSLPEGFFIRDEKLFYHEESALRSLLDDESKTKAKKKQPPTYVSSRLDVIACTRDKENENHGRLLEFRDVDGHLHKWAMPMTCLAGDGTAYREILLSKGLEIAPGPIARRLLTMYIQSCHPIERARCVDRIGWYDNDYFILPEDTIGGSSVEKVLFQGLNVHSREYSVSGSLEEWKIHVAALCQGNSRLILGVSAAFAAPLLHLLNYEGGGFHFRGPSSIGKSTTLNVASSVWGGNNPIISWRATSNGLEGVAVLHNDGLLCLDELAQIDPEEASRVAYMLPNGIGKQKMNKNSELRKNNRWTIIFLSNGEISLGQHVQKSGEKLKAGQEVRVIDIPADVGGQTAFEDLHGFPGGGPFAEHLQEVSRKYHGSAIREFLLRLIQEKPTAINYAYELIDKLLREWAPNHSNGQIRRVLRKFAILAVGGELATIFGVTGWKSGEAIEGIKQCWTAWLKERGGSGHLEEQQAISQVRRFFALHGDSRFSPWGHDPSVKTTHRAGFKKESGGVIEFYVYPEVFKKDICEGLDPTLVGKVCVAHGLLVPDSRGNPTRGENLPGHEKNVRCYRFTSHVLGEEVLSEGQDGKMV